MVGKEIIGISYDSLDEAFSKEELAIDNLQNLLDINNEDKQVVDSYYSIVNTSTGLKYILNLIIQDYGDN